MTEDEKKARNDRHTIYQREYRARQKEKRMAQVKEELRNERERKAS